MSRKRPHPDPVPGLVAEEVKYLPPERSSGSRSLSFVASSSACLRFPDLKQVHFLEVFAGDAKLSDAMARKGALVDLPWDKRA